MNEQFALKMSNLLNKTNLSDDSKSQIYDEKSIEDFPLYRNNIERYIGTVKIPLGLAGPVLVNGKYAQGSYNIPLATTEGALVASYHRGCTAISQSGGAISLVVDQGVSRAPAYIFSDIIAAEQFSLWVLQNKEKFPAIANATTRFGKLNEVKCTQEGNIVYLRLIYFTGNASGQNMVTKATQAIFDYIRNNCPIKANYSYLEGNFSSDKKASYQSLQGVRGRKVIASVVISGNILKKILGVDVDNFIQLWRISERGTNLSGCIGTQAHCSNALAALYLACGQDVACVSESSIGITTAEKNSSGDLYLTVTLPNIIVGTVGGGTRLPHARAGFELLGIDVNNPDSANIFAEIIAVVCMAGEISLVSAICANQFSRAHEVLGRRSARMLDKIKHINQEMVA